MVTVAKLIGFFTIIANVFAPPPPLDLSAPALASSRCNKAEVLKIILTLLINTLNDDGVGTPKPVTDTANIKDVVAEIKNLLNPQQIPPDLHKELSNKLEGLEKALGPEKSDSLTLPFHLPVAKKPACVKALEQLLESSKEAYAKILDSGCEEEGYPYIDVNGLVGPHDSLVNNEKGYRSNEGLEPLNNFIPNHNFYLLKNNNHLQKFIPATDSHRYPFHLKNPRNPPPRKIKLLSKLPFNYNAPFTQSLLDKLKEATRLASLKSSYGRYPSSIFSNGEVVHSPSLLQKYKTSHDNYEHPLHVDDNSPDDSELKYSKLDELLPQLLNHYDNENPTQIPDYKEVKYSVHVPDVDYGRYEAPANEYPYKYAPYLPDTGNSDEYERLNYVKPDEYRTEELESLLHKYEYKIPRLLKPGKQEDLAFTRPRENPDDNQYNPVTEPKSFNPDVYRFTPFDDYDDVLNKNNLAKPSYNLYNPYLRPGKVPRYPNYVHSDNDLNHSGNDLHLPQVASSAEIPFAFNHEAEHLQNNYPPFDKDEILEIRPGGTNQHDLTTTPNHKGVIELTYLLKKQTPIIYHPYYYVKYRIPFKDFSVQLQRLLRSRPELRSHPEELYKDLLALSVKELPADLQESAKQEIHNLVYNDGTLVKAKVLKGRAATDTIYPVLRSNDLTNENNNYGSTGTGTLDASLKVANNDATSESPKVYIHPKPITTRVYTLKEFQDLAVRSRNAETNDLAPTKPLSNLPSLQDAISKFGYQPFRKLNNNTRVTPQEYLDRILDNDNKDSGLEPKRRKRRFVGLSPFGVNSLINPLVNNVPRSVIPAVLASQQANRFLPGGFGLGGLGTRLAFGRRKKRFSGLAPFGINPLVNPLVNTVQSSVIPAVLASQQAAGVLPGGLRSLGTLVPFGRRKKRSSGLSDIDQDKASDLEPKSRKRRFVGFSPFGVNPLVNPLVNTVQSSVIPAVLASQQAAGVLPGNYGRWNVATGFGIPGAFPGHGYGIGLSGGNPLGYLG